MAFPELLAKWCSHVLAEWDLSRRYEACPQSPLFLLTSRTPNVKLSPLRLLSNLSGWQSDQLRKVPVFQTPGAAQPSLGCLLPRLLGEWEKYSIMFKLLLFQFCVLAANSNLNQHRKLQKIWAKKKKKKRKKETSWNRESGYRGLW